MRCRGCNYLLWNLPDAKCPECGRAFDWRAYAFRPDTVAVECPKCNQRHALTATIPVASKLTDDPWRCPACGATADPVTLRLIPLTPDPRDAEAIEQFTLGEKRWSPRFFITLAIVMLEFISVPAIFLPSSSHATVAGIFINALDKLIRGGFDIHSFWKAVVTLPFFLALAVSWSGIRSLFTTRLEKIECIAVWSLAGIIAADIAVRVVLFHVFTNPGLANWWIWSPPPVFLLLAAAAAVAGRINGWPQDCVLQLILRLIYLANASPWLINTFTWRVGEWLVLIASIGYVLSIFWWTARLISYRRKQI